MLLLLLLLCCCLHLPCCMQCTNKALFIFHKIYVHNMNFEFPTTPHFVLFIILVRTHKMYARTHSRLCDSTPNKKKGRRIHRHYTILYLCILPFRSVRKQKKKSSAYRTSSSSEREEQDPRVGIYDKAANFIIFLRSFFVCLLRIHTLYAKTMLLNISK